MSTSDPLSREEARRLVAMAASYGRPWSALRDRAALAIMYGCGCRSNEVRMLDLPDVRLTLHGMSIRVRSPKGIGRTKAPARPREVGLNRVAREALGDWLEVRGTAPGPLFMTARGRRVCTSHWRRKIKPLARAARIDRRVHCHGLRHTFAREMHDEGARIGVIQGALGHSSLDTTAIYLSSLGSPEIVAATVGRE